MYIYVYVCMYNVDMYVYICMYNVDMHTFTYIYIYTYACICMYVYVCVCVIKICILCQIVAMTYFRYAVEPLEIKKSSTDSPFNRRYLISLVNGLYHQYMVERAV